MLAASPDPPQWMLPKRRVFDSFTIYAGDLKKWDLYSRCRVVVHLMRLCMRVQNTSSTLALTWVG